MNPVFLPIRLYGDEGVSLLDQISFPMNASRRFRQLPDDVPASALISASAFECQRRFIVRLRRVSVFHGRAVVVVVFGLSVNEGEELSVLEVDGGNASLETMSLRRWRRMFGGNEFDRRTMHVAHHEHARRHSSLHRWGRLEGRERKGCV